MSRRVGLALMTAALGVSTGASAGTTGTLEVMSHGLRNTQGAVLCALYDRAESFPSETGAYAGTYAQITNGHAVCRFEGVPAGRYAIAAFHDEDGDRKLKTVLGIPREGYGFSNDAKPGTFGPPKFSAAAFDFDAKAKRVTLRINYP